MVLDLLLPRLIVPVPKPPMWLKGDWRFGIGEGTKIPDLSRYRNNGTISGATWAAGRHGYGLSFNGSSDYVDCGNNASLHPTAAITLEIWFKSTGYVSWNTIVSDSGNADGWRIQLGPSNKVTVRIETADFTSPSLTTQDAITDGTWYHLVATYDKDGGANNFKIYLDGELDDERTLTGELDPSTASLYLGKLGATYHYGMIDTFRLYSRALSASEVKSRYLATV